MIGPHREEDFPWNFYFNGEVMPKWGACWVLARIYKSLQPDQDDDVGHRDIMEIYTRIDHVGVPESADPDIFVYAVLEVLHILLSQRDPIFAALGEQSRGRPEEIYGGLVEAAFRMHELAYKQRSAFWTSGYDADKVYLIERIRRSQLAPNSTQFLLPPHLESKQGTLRWLREDQVRRLHKLAQSGQCDKELRKRLHEIHVS